MFSPLEMQEVGFLVAKKVDKDLAPHLLGERYFDRGLCELTGLVIIRGRLLHFFFHQIFSWK